jgi:hypothetical protein
VNLQGLDMSDCRAVSDMAPLSAMVNLQSLNMSCCNSMTSLAPLAAMVNLQSLSMSGCFRVPDLAPLAAMLTLQTLDRASDERQRARRTQSRGARLQLQCSRGAGGPCGRHFERNRHHTTQMDVWATFRP